MTADPRILRVPHLQRLLRAPFPLRVPHPCVFCKGGWLCCVCYFTFLWTPDRPHLARWHFRLPPPSPGSGQAVRKKCEGTGHPVRWTAEGGCPIQGFFCLEWARPRLTLGNPATRRVPPPNSKGGLGGRPELSLVVRTGSHLL